VNPLFARIQLNTGELKNMKKMWKITIAVFSILLLTSCVWLILSSLRLHPYVPNPIYSADGSRVMVPSVDYNKNNQNTYSLVHIEIRDVKSGKVLAQIQTRASDRMRWSIDWVDNNVVKLDSSDIGTYCWMEFSSGTWEEAKCP